ncbi:formate dehydrogenase subunit delta [Sulfitobacter sp. S45]|uniref:formate dehydrogenase subunit delta n=1 Tax=Sulfitobacter sp. S45 TaxID=3368581 RepID=UPI0037455F0B
MSPDKLIYMANQIATFFENHPHDKAVAGVAEHINNFWEPRMRAQLFEILKEDNSALSPLVIEAEPAIRRTAVAAE